MSVYEMNGKLLRKTDMVIVREINVLRFHPNGPAALGLPPNRLATPNFLREYIEVWEVEREHLHPTIPLEKIPRRRLSQRPSGRKFRIVEIVPFKDGVKYGHEDVICYLNDDFSVVKLKLVQY